MLKHALLYAAALFLLASCSLFPFPDDDDPPARDDLAGTLWTLESVETADGEVIEPEQNEDYRYFLRFSRGFAGGQDACNTCQGPYSTGDDHALSMQLACEEAGCGGAPFSLYPYSSTLNEARSYHRNGDRLRIIARGADGELVVLHHRFGP